MTILALSASPRRGGNTEELVFSFLEGARKEGKETEFIRLNDLKFRPCQACDRCAPTGRCVVQDDMQLLYPKVAACEGLVLATPVFFGTLSAQLKMFIDRFQCWWHAKYILKTPFISADEKKPAYFICVGALKKKEYVENAIYVTNIYFTITNMQSKGNLYFRGYDKAGSIKEDPQNLQQAFDEGSRFADSPGS